MDRGRPDAHSAVKDPIVALRGCRVLDRLRWRWKRGRGAEFFAHASELGGRSWRVPRSPPTRSAPQEAHWLGGAVNQCAAPAPRAELKLFDALGACVAERIALKGLFPWVLKPGPSRRISNAAQDAQGRVSAMQISPGATTWPMLCALERVGAGGVPADPTGLAPALKKQSKTPVIPAAGAQDLWVRRKDAAGRSGAIPGRPCAASRLLHVPCHQGESPRTSPSSAPPARSE